MAENPTDPDRPTPMAPPAGPPDAPAPIGPPPGLTRLLEHIGAQAAQREHEAEATRAALLALTRLRCGATTRNGLTRLESPEEVRGRITELSALAETHYVSLRTGRAPRLDATIAPRALTRSMLERGVAVRAVYPEHTGSDPQTVSYCRWLVSQGGQVRTVPAVPFQMLVVDGRRALLPIDPTDARLGALEIHDPVVLSTLRTLFDRVWHNAAALGEPTASAGPGAQERELLRLLGDGHTDESTARRLGLSVRTIQRMMADLTNRLGAESRFQAGANAVRQGWL